ncbi:hypothetical protein [Alloprevotella tannerae]
MSPSTEQPKHPATETLIYDKEHRQKLLEETRQGIVFVEVVH